MTFAPLRGLHMIAVGGELECLKPVQRTRAARERGGNRRNRFGRNQLFRAPHTDGRYAFLTDSNFARFRSARSTVIR